MNKYRSAAAALTAWAAGLSLAACAAGTTTAGTTTTTSPAAPGSSSAPSPASASASASPALASRTITVGGDVGSFPVPAGAKVAENVASSQETVIIFAKITPARVSTFYAQALPQDGYTITTNSVVSQSGGTAAIIQFTGHGFAGNIDALSKFTDSTVSVAGLGHKNVTTITFMPK
jgi:ABC-type phosphate transport system substrate-binding protein